MDVNSISQLAGAVPVTSPAPAPDPVPDDLAVERFSAAMQPPPVGDVQSGGAAEPLGVSHAVGSPGNLGEAILSSLDGWTARVRESWGVVRQPVLATDPQMSTASLLEYQARFLEFQVLFDFYSKGVSKSVQDIENTLKTQ